MRKFTCLIVDDKMWDGLEGWGRFLALARKHKYLRFSGYFQLAPKDSERAGWCADPDESIDYKILTGGTGYGFCKVHEYLERNAGFFDLLVLDLMLDTGPMDPTSKEDNTCLEAADYVDPDLDPVSEADGNRARDIAGLSFWRKVTEKDREQLIFIYSANHASFETVEQAVRITGSKRTYIMDVKPTNFDLNMTPDDVRKALCAFDEHLYRKQVSILSKQGSGVLEEIRRIIEMPGHNQAMWDKELVEEPRCQGEFWSLRTLFPKQINTIEYWGDSSRRGASLASALSEAPTPASAKQVILDAVAEAETLTWKNYIELMKWFFRHPASKPDFKKKIRKHLKNAQDLDFKIEDPDAPGPYMQLIALPDFGDTTSLNHLRDNIIGKSPDVPMAYRWPYRFSPEQKLPSVAERKRAVDYFATIAATEHADFQAIRLWTSRLTVIAKNYGVYLPDIGYISHIWLGNTRHAIAPDDCYFTLCIKGKENGDYLAKYNSMFASSRSAETNARDDGDPEVCFVWRHSGHVKDPPSVFSQESDLVSKLVDATNKPFILNDDGMTDVSKITLWHYGGRLEFHSGKRCVTVCRKGAHLKIEVFVDYPFLDGTELRVYIGNSSF